MALNSDKLRFFFQQTNDTRKLLKLRNNQRKMLCSSSSSSNYNVCKCRRNLNETKSKKAKGILYDYRMTVNLCANKGKAKSDVTRRGARPISDSKVHGLHTSHTSVTVCPNGGWKMFIFLHKNWKGGPVFNLNEGVGDTRALESWWSSPTGWRDLDYWWFLWYWGINYSAGSHPLVHERQIKHIHIKQFFLIV